MAASLATIKRHMAIATSRGVHGQMATKLEKSTSALSIKLTLFIGAGTFGPDISIGEFECVDVGAYNFEMRVTPMASPTRAEPTEAGQQLISIVVADDSPMDCELLKNALTKTRFPFRVVSCAVTTAEILHSLKAHSPHIALISENLQDGSLTSSGVLSELHNSFPETSVIVLLRSATEDLIVDAFRAGAKGVFGRAEPLQTLCKCINAVHQGQIWANSAQLRSVLAAFSTSAPLHLFLASATGRKLLTKRETEVVKLVVDGCTNRGVAEKLGLTEHTVSNYLFRIYEKLGISSRVELVLYSLKRKI